MNTEYDLMSRYPSHNHPRYHHNREGECERRNRILTEQFETAVREFYKENPQLISEEVIDEINNDEYELERHLEKIYGYSANESGIDFGKYVLENGFFNNDDEELIDKYMNDWEDYNVDFEYSEMILKDKINCFAGVIHCFIDMLYLINDIYTNMNNELYLK